MDNATYAYISRDARRQSYDEIPETCPKVDAYERIISDYLVAIREIANKLDDTELENLCDRISDFLTNLMDASVEGRVALRSKWIEALMEKMELEKKIDELQGENL